MRVDRRSDHASIARMRAPTLAIIVALLVTPAGAADVYHWTDANGVVHFADVPPPHVKADSRTLPPVVPLAVPAPGEAAAPAQAKDAGSAGGAAAPEQAAATGPAQVVVTRQDEESLGGNHHAYSGTVKNEGGSPAHSVSVAIRVIESSQQGDECLTDQIAVSPSTLAPGESGRFSAEFSHPCFAADTQTSFETVWD